MSPDVVVLTNRNKQLRKNLEKYGKICVIPRDGLVSSVHPIQPFVILESECLRPPIRPHPEYLPNKTWLDYTTHVNSVLTRTLGDKVVLSRSLLQKRWGSNARAMDVTMWQNPYETLIGEAIKEDDREFINEEYYRNLKPRRSKGKRFIKWFTEGGTSSLERAELKAKAKQVKFAENSTDVGKEEAKFTKVVKISENEKRRRQKMAAMSFQANDYSPIIDKI